MHWLVALSRGAAATLAAGEEEADSRTAPAHSIREAARTFVRENRVVFGATFALMYVSYSYLFSSLLLTNHTLPNSWVSPYPSYRTFAEGRWFADLLIWFLGGAGVASFQMFVGSALQVLNGLLFVQLARVKDKRLAFLSVAFIALYPAFLDYFSFSIDHVAFALGDTLALLGALALFRLPSRLAAFALGALAFVLALATYQPKVAFIAFLLVASCLEPARVDVRRAALALAAFVASLGIYYATVRMTVNVDQGFRTHLNSVEEGFRQVVNAYPEFIGYYAKDSDYLPGALRPALLGVVLLGAAALVRRAAAGGIRPALWCIACLAALPIALRLTYVLNSEAWPHAGRLVFVYGYALLFFLAAIGSLRALRWPAMLLTGALLYQFVVVATQETNVACFKTVFDLQKLNRIAQRVEAAVPDLYERQHALVVIGHLPMTEKQKFMRYTNGGNLSHLGTEVFEVYRQPELLDFVFGRSALRYPSVEERDAALVHAEGRRPWPAAESVFAFEDVVVVELERPGSGVPTTLTR